MRPRLPDWHLILMPFLIGIMYILSMLSGCTDKHPDAKDHGFYVRRGEEPFIVVTAP